MCVCARVCMHVSLWYSPFSHAAVYIRALGKCQLFSSHQTSQLDRVITTPHNHIMILHHCRTLHPKTKNPKTKIVTPELQLEKVSDYTK